MEWNPQTRYDQSHSGRKCTQHHKEYYTGTTLNFRYFVDVFEFLMLGNFNGAVDCKILLHYLFSVMGNIKYRNIYP